MSTSLGPSVPVHVSVHGHGHGQGNMDPGTSFVRHCWWGELAAQHDHLCPCVPVSVSMSMVLIKTNKIIYQYLRFYSSMILTFLLIYYYYYYIIMDVDIGRFFIQIFVDIFSTSCRFVPFGIFSIQRFFHLVFLTVRPFVPFGIFSI